jgi:LacI family transcriptional regulator
MSIKAKDLAKQLHISAAAVSMALNNKPGVSKETRNLVVAEAKKEGFDFSHIQEKNEKAGSIYFLIFKKNGAVVGDTPFFSEVASGLAAECKKEGYKFKSLYIYEEGGDVQRQLEDLNISDCIGIILLATEMSKEDLYAFKDVPFPIVLLDAYFDLADYDSVLINNMQGAYLATSYLIQKTGQQPGYLKSALKISNFEERSHSFFSAVREHSFAASKSQVCLLTPSIDGAYDDMKRLLESGEKPAPCYFADNDYIAIGAMRALKEKGFKIPEDVKIVGFDNISASALVEPPLTTIDVPKQYMGEQAIKRLIAIMKEENPQHLKIEVSVSLLRRKSA